MTQVNHPTFGTGTIESEDQTKITVNFNGEIKVLAVAFSRLSNLDGTKYGQQFVVKETSTKKLNKANFMSKEEFSKSKYSTMSKCDFEEERRKDAWKTRSF